MDLTSYFNYIETLARDNKNTVFLNSSAEHASYVMSRIFKYSVNHVKIFAGNLSGRVSNDYEYIINLNRFLTNGGRLSVLLQEYNETSPPSIFILFKKHKWNINIAKSGLKYYTDQEEEIHFTVGDERMYRLETDVNEFIASGNFNDPEMATMFSTYFDNAMKNINTSIITL